MGERTCSIDGCGKRPKARGWCPMHYRRWQVHGDPSLNLREESRRFHSGYEISAETGCWIWQRCVDKDGYAKFGADRRSYRGHRCLKEG